MGGIVLVFIVVLLLSGPAVQAAALNHQISLPDGYTWCSDSDITGLLDQINALRAKNNLPALVMDQVGMKDAELRAVQAAEYLQSHAPGSPGFFPHEGYDTTASSLGYNLVSENIALYSNDPSAIVNGLWQDNLHLAAMLDRQANVAGVSCVVNGIPYWTFEPGIGSAASVTTPTPIQPSAAPVPAPVLNPNPITTATATTTASSAVTSDESDFLSLLNTYRTQQGLGTVQISPVLQSAANWMSNDMATSNNMGSHIDTLGRNPYSRLAAFGYTGSPWGEVIAGGYQSAQDVLTGFINACDPDVTGACTYNHRKMLLGAGFQTVGISTVNGYWVIDLGGAPDQSSGSQQPPATSMPNLPAGTIPAAPTPTTVGDPVQTSPALPGEQTDNRAARGQSVDPSPLLPPAQSTASSTDGLSPNTYTTPRTQSSGRHRRHRIVFHPGAH